MKTEMSRLLNDQILAQQTSHFGTEDLTSHPDVHCHMNINIRRCGVMD